MDAATKFLKSHDPTTMIELVVAVFGILGSILLSFLALSAFGIDIGTPTGAVAAITAPAAVFALAAVAISYSALNIYGILKHNLRLRSLALFTQILVRLYTLIAVFLVQGFFPITWIASFTVFGVVIVCYLTVRRKIRYYEGLR
jgi:hypothetical protein